MSGKGLPISRAGNYYVKGKNLLLVFKERPRAGYIVTAIEIGEGKDRRVGSVFVSYNNILQLVGGWVP